MGCRRPSRSRLGTTGRMSGARRVAAPVPRVPRCTGAESALRALSSPAMGAASARVSGDVPPHVRTLAGHHPGQSPDGDQRTGDRVTLRTRRRISRGVAALVVLACLALPASALADATVTTGSASAVSQTQATLNGTRRSRRRADRLPVRVRDDDRLRVDDGHGLPARHRGLDAGRSRRDRPGAEHRVPLPPRRAAARRASSRPARTRRSRRTPCRRCRSATSSVTEGTPRRPM